MSPSSNVEPKRPGAYSVSTESNGQPEMFQLKIPANTLPGNTFTFTCGNRRNMTARCPPSCQPGDMVQIAVQPPGTTQYTLLKMANLTVNNYFNNADNISNGSNHGGGVSGASAASANEGSGGAQKMTPQVLRANQELLAVDSKSFLVTVPPNVQPGMQFVVKTPHHGQQFLVTCPKNAGPGQKIRMAIPNTTKGQPEQQQQPQDENDIQNLNGNNNVQTKVFEIVAPPGCQPNQKIPVLICGKRTTITLPANVQAGQKIKLKVPIHQVLGSIELSYNDETTSTAGWYRTIRMSDLKFQWVRVDNNKTEQEAEDSNTNQHVWKTTAFVRKLLVLQGNDSRMPTGHIDLVHADQAAVVESELVHDNRTLISYATIAHVQQLPLEEKTTWFQNLCGELTSPWESGRIKIIVRRRHLLSDSVHAIMSLSRIDMRKRWRIEFSGEPAIDSGGVMREWFQLITEQIFNPDLGLWLSSVNNQVCLLINPASDISCPDDHLIYFRFLGRIMGRALFDRQLIHGHMVRHLYKHLLGWPITFEDLQSNDEEFYLSLKHLTTLDDDNISALCLDFTTSEDTLGMKKTIELVPNGSNVEVTAANLPEFLQAILRYRMLDRTKSQTAELLLGFFDVVPEPALTVFDPNELELILCGLPSIDMDDWQENSLYTGLYEQRPVETCKTLTWFWEIIRNDFDQEMKARLLQFVTGTSGVPSRGFSVLQGNDGNIKRFTIHGVDRETYEYPRAQIDLPEYNSKKELLDRLRTAVTLSATGFDIE